MLIFRSWVKEKELVNYIEKQQLEEKGKQNMYGVIEIQRRELNFFKVDIINFIIGCKEVK